MPLSMTPGSSIIASPELRCRHRLRRVLNGSAFRNPFHAGHVFRGFPIHAFATACQVARSPVRIRPICSALGSFYFQASNGSVALPVAGYDYNSDWTPLLAGLSPAGMSASLAAPDPDLTLSRRPLVAPLEGCPLPLNIGFLPLPVDPMSKAMACPLRSATVDQVQVRHQSFRVHLRNAPVATKAVTTANALIATRIALSPSTCSGTIQMRRCASSRSSC